MLDPHRQRALLKRVGTVAVLLAVIAPIVFYLLRSSQPCVEAFGYASRSPDVQRVLGTPVELGWFVTGSMSSGSTGGNANLTLRLSGPNGKGRVHVRARQPAGGAWSYDELSFESEHTRFSLLGR